MPTADATHMHQMPAAPACDAAVEQLQTHRAIAIVHDWDFTILDYRGPQQTRADYRARGHGGVSAKAGLSEWERMDRANIAAKKMPMRVMNMMGRMIEG